MHYFDQKLMIFKKIRFIEKKKKRIKFWKEKRKRKWLIMVINLLIIIDKAVLFLSFSLAIYKGWFFEGIFGNVNSCSFCESLDVEKGLCPVSGAWFKAKYYDRDEHSGSILRRGWGTMIQVGNESRAWRYVETTVYYRPGS